LEIVSNVRSLFIWTQHLIYSHTVFSGWLWSNWYPVPINKKSWQGCSIGNVAWLSHPHCRPDSRYCFPIFYCILGNIGNIV
jgi:hypothetical protein